jgi:hypothetical protein
MLGVPRPVLGLLALLGAVVFLGCGSSSSSSPTTTGGGSAAARLGPAFGDMTALPGVLTTPPPWSANTSMLQQRLRKIGLPALAEEGQVVHIHQHLDLFVDGKPVTVPADLGIDASNGFFSPLHTHDATGILHVESPTVSEFSLGQFFAVWGVRLDRRCIGGLCAGAGKQSRAWVDGKPLTADPTRIVLAAHQEIVLAYGTAAQMPKPIPSSYSFPAGD